MIIAIDGPAASGKSTVAQAVAARLGFRYLDTGAMYRSVAARALHLGVPLDDDAALERLAEEETIAFAYESDSPVHTRVTAGGQDVTGAIRTPEVDAAVSAVARVPGVRAALVRQQRALVAGLDAVVEGRDIGSVVFPDAAVKVFLTASPDERARRRHAEMADAGHDFEGDEVRERIERRDTADSTRETSPLQPAPDAESVDTTSLSIEQVVERIVGRAGEQA